MSNQSATLQENVNAINAWLTAIEVTVAGHARKLDYLEDQLERVGAAWRYGRHLD